VLGWDIGPDIYGQGTLFADAERERINAFDWYAVPPTTPESGGELAAFPSSMRRGARG